MKLNNLGILQHIGADGQDGAIEIVFVMDNYKSPSLIISRGCEAVDIANVLKKLADIIIEIDSSGGRTSQDALH